jgi:hypothetical protein
VNAPADRHLGRRTLDREQVPGAAQALDVAQVHNLVPRHLAERQNLARAPVLSGSEHRDVDLDLGPVGCIRDHAGPYLPGRPAEDRGIGGYSFVTAHADVGGIQESEVGVRGGTRSPWPSAWSGAAWREQSARRPGSVDLALLNASGRQRHRIAA